MSAAENIYCEAPLYYMSGLEDVATVNMPIHNGRLANNLSWEREGFELMQHTSAVERWDDDDEIARVYYAEMRAFARALTGADHALIGGHISRNPESAREHSDYAPIQYVHSDFTDNYGELIKDRYLKEDPEHQRMLAQAGMSADDFRKAKRLMILQFWRNVGPEVMDLPLAFCDATSVPHEEMVAIHVPNYADSGLPFDAFGVKRPATEKAHRWYVFPEMSVDEVAAFRTFDSERVGSEAPFWTPHSAFRDPHFPDAPDRRSIEVRATCLFM